MPGKRKPSTPTPTSPATAELRAPVIDPRAVFTLSSARALLGLAVNCLPRAIRRGQLRVSRRGGRYYITGEWLLDWVSSGPGAKQRRQAEGPGGGAAA